MTSRAASMLVAGVLAATLSACSGDGPDVDVAEVGRGTVVETVDAPATVTARASATVSAPAAGRVAQLFVRDGQAVRGGALLLRIDSPEAQARLRDARQADAAAAANRIELPAANLSGVQAQLDAAAAAAFAAARAAAAGIDDPARRRQAEQQVVTAERSYRAARADAQRAIADTNAGIGELSDALSALTTVQRTQTRAAVALAQQTVAALDVRAPISGVVTLGSGSSGSSGGPSSGLLDQLPDELQGALGGAVPGGDSGPETSGLAAGVPVSTGAVVATVTDVSTLGVSAEVDETDVLLVQPGVPATIELDAVPDASYTGVVTAVETAAAASAGGGVMFQVRVSLSAGRLADGGTAPTPKPGMSAVANLQVRRAQNVLRVPAAAVVRDEGRDAVWVVRGDVVRRRLVQLGAQGEDEVEIRSGLKAGDRIVVRGADEVREGLEL